jgi:hypothetical protein
VSIFGGTVDSVALAIKNAGHERWFFGYGHRLYLRVAAVTILRCQT